MMQLHKILRSAFQASLRMTTVTFSRMFILLILLALSFVPSAHAGLTVKRSSSLGPTDGLVGYWPFDGPDIAGTTAYDRSGQGNNGTITGGPLKIIGKLGQALRFDGAGRRVEVDDKSVFTFGMGSFSVSLWLMPYVYPTAQFSNEAGLATKLLGDYSKGWGTLITSTGHVALYVRSSVDDHNVMYSSAVVPLNQWSHAVFIVDRSLNTIRVILNTFEDEPGSDITGYGNFDTDASVKIGVVRADLSMFDGIIDDVRIYNRALSVEEIKGLYALGKGMVTAASQQNNLTSGLVGYWSFNGVDISGNTVYDRSPVGTNNGTLNGAVRAAGKLGQGLYFDGSDGGVIVPHSSSINLTSSMTLAAWVKPPDPVPWHGAFFEKQPWSATYHFGTACSNPQGIAYLLGGTEIFELANVLFPNRWTHVAVTFDDTSDQAILYLDGIERNQNTYTGTIPGSIGNLAIGYRAGTPGQAYKGLLDDMRMYNRALSAEEIKVLYNQAASRYQESQENWLTTGLVGYWPFNGPDVSGTVAYDRSGQGYDGTMVSSPLKVIGKVGQALSFNGDDGVSLNDAAYDMSGTDAFTISAWVYPRSGGGGTIFARGGVQAGEDNIVYNLRRYDPTRWEGQISNGVTQVNFISDTGVVLDDTWQHIALVWSGASDDFRMYRNGVSIDNTTSTIALWDGDHPNDRKTGIGYEKETGESYFDGNIDEVRIYNRALSADEVKQLYNMGR